ncbi:hypothetical protein BWO90_26610 [Sinorhizobium meliloti]|nr:hypothetical protein BWO76_24790 [Sinorhizobium meliloti]ATB05436.1 hypothetical protein BWO90_26610 [Sinorhizobium meliloti]
MICRMFLSFNRMRSKETCSRRKPRPLGRGCGVTRACACNRTRGAVVSVCEAPASRLLGCRGTGRQCGCHVHTWRGYPMENVRGQACAASPAFGLSP